jgi:hypothetical protein
MRKHAKAWPVTHYETALLSALAIALPARVAAAANTRDACFTAYEQAQRLRQDGKLRASRAELTVCADAACPRFVKKDCSTWIGEVEAKMSAIAVVGAHTSAAESRVAIYVDGARLPDPLAGEPTPVDPGPHDIRYELDGRFVERQVVVPEGDKSFSLILDVGTLFPTAPQAPQAPRAPQAPQDVAHPADTPAPAWYARLPVPTYVLGAVSALGLVSFASFALQGKATEACAPSCTRSEVSSLRAQYLAADVSLATAIAAGAGAVYFALTTKPQSASGSASPLSPAFWIGMGPETGGAAIAAGGTF